MSRCWTGLPAIQIHRKTKNPPTKVQDCWVSRILHETRIGERSSPETPAAGLLTDVRRRGDDTQWQAPPLQLCWDVLLPSKSKWADIFNEMVKCLRFNVWNVLYVVEYGVRIRHRIYTPLLVLWICGLEEEDRPRWIEMNLTLHHLLLPAAVLQQMMKMEMKRSVEGCSCCWSPLQPSWELCCSFLWRISKPIQ